MSRDTLSAETSGTLWVAHQNFQWKWDYIWHPRKDRLGSDCRLWKSCESSKVETNTQLLFLKQNYEEISWFKSSRPGAKVINPCVVDIRQLQIKTEGNCFYNLILSSGQNATTNSEKEIQPWSPPIGVTKASQEPCTIVTKTYRDLQHIKTILHPSTHIFYSKILSHQ